MKKKVHTRHIIPPPVLLTLFFVAGLSAHRALPLPVSDYAIVLGVFLFACSIAVSIWVIEVMRGKSEHPSYRRETKQLITTGPFSMSRNPLYMAAVAAYFGASLIFNTWWPIFLSPFVIAWIHFAIIEKEEEYLKASFGKKYDAYTKKVPRYF